MKVEQLRLEYMTSRLCYANALTITPTNELQHLTLSRAHSCANAADPAKLVPFNKCLVKHGVMWGRVILQHRVIWGGVILQHMVMWSRVILQHGVMWGGVILQHKVMWGRVILRNTGVSVLWTIMPNLPNRPLTLM